MATVSAPLGSPAYNTSIVNAFKNAADDLSRSAERLASGNRIIQVSDDVGAVSVSAKLQTQIAALNQASANAAQGTSLLQVAQSGLTQIGDLLSNLSSLATKATSSALSNTDRGYLQQQFTQSLSEIDSIVSNTTFGGMQLLNGALSNGALQTLTNTATQATGSITLTGNPSAGQTVVLNGATLTANVDFAIGATASDTATNLANALNSSTNTALSQAGYSASGSTITITAKSGGTYGNQYVVNKATSTAAFTVSGASTNAANVYTLSGGANNGLYAGSVKGVGTIGDNIITAQSETPASVSLTVSGAVNDGEQLQIDDGNGGTINFTFKNSPVGATDIQIGATTEATLQNAVKTLSQYSGSDNYGLRQLNFSVNGNQLTLTSNTAGNPKDLSGANLDISETLANGSLSAATFSNGTNTGVDTTGVTNPDFTGTVSGFTATYVSPNVVSASVTVGSATYTATISNTAPGGSTTARFTSGTGGYFDVQLAGGNGSAVANQSDANSYAGRLNSAFAGLSFYQQRPVDSFRGTGTLTGSSSGVTLGTFSDPHLTNVSVTAPSSPGADGTIDITVNGNTFRASSGLGGQIGAGETVRFTSLSNSNESLTLVNGSTVQDFSNTDNAAAFASALHDAFNIGTTGAGVFQIGVDAGNTISVSIGNVGSSVLFNGSTPSVGTTQDAAAAETSVTRASNLVKTALSNVGALQSNLDYASGSIQSSILAVSAANSNLVDTNIVSETSTYAIDTLRVNSGLAVAAQTLALQNGLLSILHSAAKA